MSKITKPCTSCDGTGRKQLSVTEQAIVKTLASTLTTAQVYRSMPGDWRAVNTSTAVNAALGRLKAAGIVIRSPAARGYAWSLAPKGDA